MRYFFILGSNPVLSAAEIIALLPGTMVTVREIYRSALVVEAEDPIDVNNLMSRLGGTVKIGRLMTEEEDISVPKAIEFMTGFLTAKVPTGRTTDFGYSLYALESSTPIGRAAALTGPFSKTGMEVKRLLKEAGIPARWVKAQTGPALTSVAVGKNRLIEGGAEFVIITKGGQMRIGVTDCIQPFEEFSETDYGRPSRDTEQGMLPPKLARIMVNLIHVSVPVMEIALLDPFCGSGTVLTEALRMGFDRVYGSDKNQVAIDSTQQNISWLREKGHISAGNHVKLITSDARFLGTQLPERSIDAIVTEPFLGPPRTGDEKRGDMQRQLNELTKLYYECLSAWRRILRPNAPVVMALPVYIVGMEKHGIQVSEFEKLGFKTESLLPTRLLSRLNVPETRNKGLLYGRNDQHVWREIVRMRAE